MSGSLPPNSENQLLISRDGGDLLAHCHAAGECDQIHLGMTHQRFPEATPPALDRPGRSTSEQANPPRYKQFGKFEAVSGVFSEGLSN